MVERNLPDNPEKPLSPLESGFDFELHCEREFNRLSREQNLEEIDASTQNLLGLALENRMFSPRDRLNNFVYISSVTMSRLREFAPNENPDIVKHAEMIHSLYAQIYAQSIVEMARLDKPGASSQQT